MSPDQRRKSQSAPNIGLERLQLEKRLFRQNKMVISDLTTVDDPAFKAYWRNYKKSVSHYQRVAKLSEMTATFAKSDIVLVGDYHTLNQSQRSFVRMIRAFLESGGQASDLVVGLETVQARFQGVLDRFLADQITTDEFIKKIGFRRHWFFDLWYNYTVIFDFLKYHKIPVVALDHDSRQKESLSTRDQFIAEKLHCTAKKYKNKKIVVLIGDLHLAPKHLPQEIERKFSSDHQKPMISTFYQNSPAIYWRLCEKGVVDHTQLVKVAPMAFCRMHTPPLIVQQSYLNWLYHEEGAFDWVDAKTSFLQLVERLASVLAIELPEDWENVDVSTCGDFGFLATLGRKKLFSPAELKFIRKHVRRSESYFLPRARQVYLANVSLNHAAEEAGNYLHYLMVGEDFPRHPKDAFYATVLHEAAGFLSSKIINPKRRCPRNPDFLNELKFLEKSGRLQDRQLDYETASEFVRHHRSVSKGQLLHTNRIAGFSSELFLALTQAIGSDLGDHLYYAFSSGVVKRQEIRDLFVDRFEEDAEPGLVYLNFVRKIKTVRRPPHF